MPIRGVYTPYDRERVRNAIAYIHIHYAENISADQLSMEVNINIKLLQKIIQKLTGHTVHNYLIMFRLERAKDDLSNFRDTVECIAIRNGFSSSSHFSKKFKEKHGLTPQAYRFKLIDE